MSRAEGGGEAWWTDTDVEPSGLPSDDLRLLADRHRCDDGIIPRCTYCRSRWPCDTAELLDYVAHLEAQAQAAVEAEIIQLRQALGLAVDAIQDLYAAVEAAERDCRFILDTLDALAATVDAHLEFGTGASLIGLKSMLKQARKVQRKALAARSGREVGDGG